jgi:hypothetical protein
VAASRGETDAEISQHVGGCLIGNRSQRVWVLLMLDRGSYWSSGRGGSKEWRSVVLLNGERANR